MHEERRARLHRLADSINDTARMARTSLSIMLLVALYLGLTLVASTDQNLLLDGQVTLPQMGAGISVAESYIFAPPIFLYLHIQLLFLLSVLARKINTFETALKEEFPDAIPPHPHNKTDAERRECWEWLSAFAFVQLLRRTPGRPRDLKMVARTLAWLSIEAAPLVLLFLIAISFVRYQSVGITWSHHLFFVLDSVAIIIFNWFVFRRRDRIRGSASVSGGVPGNAGVPSAFGVGQWPALLGRIDRLMHYRIWWKHLRGLSAICLNWRILVRSAKVMPGRLWSSVGGTGIVALCMALLLICYAYPPQFSPQSVEDDRRSIWREDDREFWQAVWHRGENLLDAGPCRWWGLGCRYLDVSNMRLLGTQTVEDIQPFHLGSPDLTRRRFRFAKFVSAYLPGVDLGQTELQGADLGGTELQGANLRGAELQGANLAWAKLQGANLREAKLQRANLEEAGLQGANLRKAELQGANLSEAELQGANLREARLQGANFTRAELQGASLQEAKLQGASLVGAKLQEADLVGAKLQGANLREAALLGSRGQPNSWCLTWMPHVSFVPFDSSKYLEEFLSDKKIKNIKLAWKKENTTLQQYLERSLSSGSDGKIFGGAKPEEEDMVFHTLEDQNWPKKPDVNSDDYWTAWAEWTADFACENEYTACSSLQRWGSRVPEFPQNSLLPAPSEQAQKKIRDAIRKASKRDKCPGLHALTEDERREFVDGQPRPSRTRPVCTP